MTQKNYHLSINLVNLYPNVKVQVYKCVVIYFSDRETSEKLNITLLGKFKYRFMSANISWAGCVKNARKE